MIDDKSVEKIARLARIKLEPEQCHEFSIQLSKVLDYFDQISQVDTSEIEPMTSPSEIETYWREDVVRVENSAEEITANAPSKIGHLFKVPPVV